MGAGPNESHRAEAAQPAHDWPLRPWLLAGLLALGGLLIHFATLRQENDPGRMALAAFLFFGPLAAAFSLERERWKEASVFALAAGLVMAGLAWRAVGAGDHYADEQYGFFAGVFALLLALPLFQAGFHRHRFATPYRDTHFFVWTDAVCGAGALAFTGLSFVLLWVLGDLFRLIRITVLHDLLEDGWFCWTVAGLAFGASLGVLRNSLKIIGTLQSVVLLVLSLLAVPLAAALVIFLVATMLSGPGVLWEATRSATPVLLSCAAGCFILANAIVRESDTDMTRSAVMRVTAFVLAMGILPLTAFAAVSMGLRIAQHGLSPERLWGLVAVAVACAYGLAAWGAALRGRLWGWRPFLRGANMNLAVGVSVLALFLALPILDFGAIAAANQVARLESGKVSAKDFDYDALRWDFGDAGRRALARLAKSGKAEVARLAKEAQGREVRSWPIPDDSQERTRKRLANLRFDFADPALREGAEAYLRSSPFLCDSPCVALDLGKYPDGSPHLAIVEAGVVDHLTLDAQGAWSQAVPAPPAAHTGPPPGAQADATPRVEVRPWSGRQIYVDGKPVGEPFQ